MADFVTSDGLRLHVEVAGPEHAPTVVLAHGLAASIALGWGATGVLDRLAHAGLRTVAYDARGHGRSDAPHEADRYGDDRAAADLTEVFDAFADRDAILTAYSMGSATSLLALETGLGARGAVLGAIPSAVLGWTDADEMQRNAAVAALDGSAADPSMQWWVGFLDATGADKVAIAALLRRINPVVQRWEQIVTPIVVAAGIDDASVAPSSELLARLDNVSFLQLAGDHVSAAASPQFTDAVIALARSTG